MNRNIELSIICIAVKLYVECIHNIAKGKYIDSKNHLHGVRVSRLRVFRGATESNAVVKALLTLHTVTPLRMRGHSLSE